MQKPQGGTLIFSCIRRLGSFFWFKILNFNIFWGFQEKIIFWGGMRILWIVFGVITKLNYILGSFLKVKVQTEG